MSITIDIGAVGFEEAERALIRMIALITDLRPFWPKLVPLFIGWMREQFDTEGEWGGTGWEALSPDYLVWKEQHYPGKGILYATGDLRQAASRPLRIVTPTTLSLIIDDSGYRHGGKDPRSVAPYHQEGTDTMPARPIIPEVLPMSAQAEVRAVAEEWVAEMAKRLGL